MRDATRILAPRFDSLAEWLSWQERLHPNPMDLGLERVREVATAMQWPGRRFPLVVVAGTNGKGSCVAYLESAYTAAGFRVGSYTSPHLVRYNERIRIDTVSVDDAAIMTSFAALDRVRGDTTLTYFEFGTLAAMDQFQRQAVDVAIMEVGIGGRLDAVNVFDADVAVVTTVDVDHQKWLGDDRESIGTEKAGIFRTGRPAVCGESAPPESVLRRGREVGAQLWLLGEHFGEQALEDGWRWWGGGTEMLLPTPLLAGDFQRRNAATAVQVLTLLDERVPVPASAIRAALLRPGLRGRFETLSTRPAVVLDVAHNAQALSALARNLADRPVAGRTLAVAALLVEKATAAALAPVVAQVAQWFVAGVDDPRGDDGRHLLDELAAAGVAHPQRFECVTEAFTAALAEAGPDDRVLVFGSFHTVGDVLARIGSERSGHG